MKNTPNNPNLASKPYVFQDFYTNQELFPSKSGKQSPKISHGEYDECLRKQNS